MFKLFNNYKFKKFNASILNSKKTYIILFVIILIQFLLVSIIFLQNKKSEYLIKQTNLKVMEIGNQQRQLDAKLNSIRSNIMRMSAQLYRLRREK